MPQVKYFGIVNLKHAAFEKKSSKKYSSQYLKQESNFYQWSRTKSTLMPQFVSSGADGFKKF